MRLDVFMLAEAAVGNRGKLFIHGGGVTDIEAPMLPWTHPQLAVVVRLAASEKEAIVPHELGIQLTAPDESDVLSRFAVEMPPSRKPRTQREERYYDIVLTISPLTFSAEGTHRFVLDVDGDVLRSMELPVMVRGDTPHDFEVPQEFS